MKLKKKEDQSVDTSILLRRGNKIPMVEVTETNCGAQTVLSKVLSSNSSNHMVAHNHLQWDPTSSFGVSEDSYSVLV